MIEFNYLSNGDYYQPDINDNLYSFENGLLDELMNMFFGQQYYNQ